MESYLAKARANFNFRTPIVGVHVRRTDKVGTEAAFHPLSEYMKYVEEYYDSMEIARMRAKKVKSARKQKSDSNQERNTPFFSQDYQLLNIN